MFAMTNMYNNKIVILSDEQRFIEKVNLLQLRQCDKQLYSRDERTIQKTVSNGNQWRENK